MSKKIYRLGTRKSALAKTQTEWVRAQLMACGIETEVIETESPGDTDRTTPLYEMELNAPGIFTKHLEDELLARRIDLAVHSLKDLPTMQPEGLVVACIPVREKTNDCLFIKSDLVAPDAPFSLPKGAVVGTSSLRRQALLASVRPDVTATPIRGNVPTRLKAVVDGKVTAVLLAAAGVTRLGLSLDGLTRIDLPEDVFPPAPGQGALGVEVAESADPELRAALSSFHDPKAALEATLERRVLRGLEGGCTLPLGVRVRVTSPENPLKIKAFLGIQSDENSGNKAWKSFHYFESEEINPDELVSKTIQFFKELK